MDRGRAPVLSSRQTPTGPAGSSSRDHHAHAALRGAAQALSSGGRPDAGGLGRAGAPERARHLESGARRQHRGGWWALRCRTLPVNRRRPAASVCAKTRDGMVAERDADVLDLAVEVEAVAPAVAAYAAALRAAERRVQ